jgi:pyruvate-formate lyase
VALDTEVRELASHIGLCVANIKDSLEAIGRLLRDERRRDEEDHA